MASLINRNGLRELHVCIGAGRKVIRLGRVSKTAAETTKRHVEQLVDQHNTAHPVDRHTRAWLADISDTLYDRIAATSLVEPRVSIRLGPFIDKFVTDRGPEFKPATVEAWEYAKKSLVGYFTAERDIRTITRGDAQAFRAWLIEQGKAEATVRRRCAHAKNMLGYAVSCRLIDDNPFGNKAVPTASPRSKAKAFIDDALSRRILEHLPDSRWRLIWSLARWGGVRVPSEICALRWDGVDQAAGRLVVYSPKTERYEGQERRVIPLFIEIERALVDWYEVSYLGEPMVFPGASVRGSAYRTPVLEAIKRAGGKPWPKLWTAVRATRRAELKQPMPNGLRLPDEAINAWMGHSTAVAEAHYGTGGHVVEQAFDAVLGTTGRSKMRSRQSMPSSATERKKPRTLPIKAGGGVSDWPTRNVGHFAIALLFRRLCDERREGAAPPPDWSVLDELSDRQQHDLSAVARLLVGMKDGVKA
jgi:integrase